MIFNSSVRNTSRKVFLVVIVCFACFGVWEFFLVISGRLRNGVVTPNGDDRFLAKKSNGEPMYNVRQDMLMIHLHYKNRPEKRPTKKKIAVNEFVNSSQPCSVRNILDVCHRV
jgi:hypothetical protein